MVQLLWLLLGMLGFGEPNFINDTDGDTITTIQKDDTGGETGQVPPPKK